MEREQAVMKESTLAKLFDGACERSPTLKRFLIKNWYQYLSGLDKQAHMPFMNLGYVSPEIDKQSISLETSDEPHRYCIQMYHHVAGAVDLRGLRVLEVGSGRGGGASYVMRYLGPHSMIGVDIASKATQFCRHYHNVDGLSFFQGDAEALPFGNHSFDAVINIESSFAYGHADRFFREVFRVLRPGGYFLFADYRNTPQMGTLRRQLKEAGLSSVQETCINEQVVKAMELDSARRLALIQNKVPSFMQSVLHDFAGTPGTRMHTALTSGTVDYRSWVLTKENQKEQGAI